MRRFRRHTPIETYLLFDRAEPPPEKPRVKEKDGVVANILIIEQQQRRRRRLNNVLQRAVVVVSGVKDVMQNCIVFVTN